MNNKKGFTLIELVLVLSLVGIVSSIIFSPIIFTFNSFSSQNDKVRVSSSLMIAMDYLTREVQKAESVEVIGGNKIKIDSREYKVEEGNLKVDNDILLEDIEKLIVSENNKKVKIEIIVIDKNGKENSLSIIVNKR